MLKPAFNTMYGNVGALRKWMPKTIMKIKVKKMQKNRRELNSTWS